MDGNRRISDALKRYWGYEAFRPGQEAIVRGIASGRDACVVMPTGGGKSLCYQLPAAMDESRTAVVISPLIALMQDQVAQLAQMGIPAVYLNSATASTDRSDVKRRATAGEYRLLYLSPERLALDGAAEWLRKVPVSFFAIDEAHCISEWGHDFRPDYRQLSRLRELFPDRSIAAFTASATQRVRHDIIAQLRLRDPYKHIASFRRPNLRYIVQQCDGGTQSELLMRAVRRVSEGNVIVYAPTIARVGETVDLLQEHGIAAIGYHGQMDSTARRENQEKWMADEVRVLVGTLAFGLGINKAAVRAVIHLSLPKSVEQYYQEAGRAGRDGLPADCFLFWQKKDSGLHAYFIGQIGDAAEKERAWQRYHEIKRFVEASDCRQRHVCRHFGETPKWEKCEQCDVCAGMPEWMEVEQQRPRRKRAGRAVLPPQVVRSRYATAGSGSALTSVLSIPRDASGSANDPNSELREYLREWRRNTAREKGIAAFLVLPDTALDDFCRKQPSNLRELMQVSGFGEKKTEIYGDHILAALKRFQSGDRAQNDWKAKVSHPAEETLRLLQEGRTFEEIAQIRGRKIDSVIALVADLIESGDAQFQKEWVAPEKYSTILDACKRVGHEKLKPIKESLPEDVSYNEIRLVAAQLRAENEEKKT